jgi:hypothetical protein
MARSRHRASKHTHNGKSGVVRLYGAYVFKDKDPAIDQLRTLVERHYGKRVNNKDLTEITESGGPSTACMRAWFFGKTLRPQNPTLEAAGRAMGYERIWRRMKENK